MIRVERRISSEGAIFIPPLASHSSPTLYIQPLSHHPFSSHASLRLLGLDFAARHSSRVFHRSSASRPSGPFGFEYGIRVQCEWAKEGRRTTEERTGYCWIDARVAENTLLVITILLMPTFRISSYFPMQHKFPHLFPIVPSDSSISEREFQFFEHCPRSAYPKMLDLPLSFINLPYSPVQINPIILLYTVSRFELMNSLAPSEDILLSTLIIDPVLRNRRASSWFLA
jgi:hypothetical protein